MRRRLRGHCVPFLQALFEASVGIGTGNSRLRLASGLDIKEGGARERQRADLLVMLCEF